MMSIVRIDCEYNHYKGRALRHAPMHCRSAIASFALTPVLMKLSRIPKELTLCRSR
jgi:hypothetical protein